MAIVGERRTDTMAEAYASLDAWIAENDPDGEMGAFEQIDAYAASAGQLPLAQDSDRG